MSPTPVPPVANAIISDLIKTKATASDPANNTSPQASNTKISNKVNTAAPLKVTDLCHCILGILHVVLFTLVVAYGSLWLGRTLSRQKLRPRSPSKQRQISNNLFRKSRPSTQQPTMTNYPWNNRLLLVRPKVSVSRRMQWWVHHTVLLFVLAYIEMTTVIKQPVQAKPTANTETNQDPPSMQQLATSGAPKGASVTRNAGVSASNCVFVCTCYIATQLNWLSFSLHWSQLLKEIDVRRQILQQPRKGACKLLPWVLY